MRNTLAMLVLGSENVPSTGMTLPSGSPEPLRRIGAVSRTALSGGTLDEPPSSSLVHAPESKRNTDRAEDRQAAPHEAGLACRIFTTR